MAEPTLSLTKADLEAEIGAFLGFGRGTLYAENVWTDEQTRAIQAIRASGERQFYYNPALPDLGIPAGYDWSFLKPVSTASLAQNVPTVPLPDDYGGFEGQITISQSGQAFVPIDLVGIGMIYGKFASSPTSSGRPQMACAEPLKGTSGTQGQRFQLRVWPTPDTNYTLQFQYYVNPDALTTARPYMYGGAQHAETILESCLAIAEQRLNDKMMVHTEKFKERLLASINIDRRSKPQTLGYNHDRSWRHRHTHARPWDFPPVFVNGSLPG